MSGAVLYLFKGLAQEVSRTNHLQLAQVYDQLSARIGLTNWHVCRAALARRRDFTADELIDYPYVDDIERRFAWLKSHIERVRE